MGKRVSASFLSRLGLQKIYDNLEALLNYISAGK